MPSARPVKAQSAQDFVARMKGLAGTKLQSATWPLRLPVAKSLKTMPT
jgi:hypothetical protein